MKISKSSVIQFIQLFLFLIPVGFIQNRIIMFAWYGLLAISVAKIYLSGIERFNKTIRNSVLWFMALYLVIQVISTYLNHGDWLYGIFTIIIIVALIFFAEENAKKDLKQFLKIFDIVLLTEIAIESLVHLFNLGHFLLDFACVYLYYSVWATIHLLVTMHDKKKGKLIYIVSGIMVLITIINPQKNSDGSNNYEWTFYIACILMCFVYANRRLVYKWGSFINIKNVYLVIGAFNVVFVILQNPTLIPGVEFLFVNIMKKDITMTGRTHIWEMTIARILDRPIFGYGSSFLDLQNSSDYWAHWLGVYGPHNQFLAVCLAGGFTTLTAYLILCVKSTIGVNKYKKHPEAIIVSSGILSVYLLLSVTYRNIINCIPLFILFVISANISGIITQE